MQPNIDDKILLNMAINNIEEKFYLDKEQFKAKVKEQYKLYKEIHKEVFQ